MISLSVTDWREIRKKLKIEVEALESLHDNSDNTCLIVEDILLEYIKRYPMTSIGFVCHILQECKEEKALNAVLSFSRHRQVV